ncbi:MAG TPA: VOC family protein [Kofleriaceae bacterium]|nr:VOC family protein [Kofleriaceae bacterium]
MAKYKRPEGHHTITPGFSCQNAAKVITFLEQAFGGKVVDKYEGPGGSIMHVEVMIGDSVVMFGEPMPGTQTMPGMLSFYVDDGDAVDATYKRALAAGATTQAEPKNQFYGYRSATVRDAGGNAWTICAIVEQLTVEEMHRRAADMMKG